MYLFKQLSKHIEPPTPSLLLALLTALDLQSKGLWQNINLQISPITAP